jgi:hypothetical protein
MSEKISLGLAHDIACEIKNHLVKLAENDQLSLDMTQLDEMDLMEVVQSKLPTAREKAIEKASCYISETDDEDGNFLSVETQLIRIAQHPNKTDFIDYVEGVCVCQPLEYTFFVNDFLEIVGWVD